MKKLTIFIVIVALNAFGCKKDEKSPTPSTPATPTSGLTTTETALLGKWTWDKTEFYNAGAIINTFDPAYCLLNYPAGSGNAWVRPATFECRSTLNNVLGNLYSSCHIYDAISDTGRELDTTMRQGWWCVYPVGYEGNSYFPSLYPCERVRWEAALDGVFMFPNTSGPGLYIETLTSTNLVLTSWNGGPTGTGGLANGGRYFYHK